MRERSAERACCLLVLNLVSSTPPYPPAGAACRVLGDSLGVCGRVYVCTQAFIGFLAFELLVNNASSATLAFSLRLVHMLQTREKQTRRWAALSKHQHACVRLGMQCMQDLMLCVWPDHACLSLGQEACSVHKQAVMLRTPGSPRSSRRRPCTLVERLAAVGVVAQPDRQGQLGKADGRRVGLVGWWAGLWHWSSRLQVKWAGKEGSSSAC